MRPDRLILVIALFVGCLFSCVGRAAGNLEFTTRLWQAEDGLPHNIVQAIAQTSDGYLWVGTREGLARFDGVGFQNVPLLPGGQEPSILCLLASQDGSLWIGTEGHGVFHLSAGKMEQCEFPGGARNLSFTEIQEGADKVIWFASPSGLFHWSHGQMRRRAEFKFILKSLCVDTNGVVWDISNGQLTCLAGTNSSNYVVKSGSLPGWVRQIYCDSEGVFWIAAGNGAGNGLLRLKDGVVTAFRKAAGAPGIVSAVLRDSAGRLWIGSRSGLSWFVEGSFINQSASGEPSYQINAIFEDREKNIWVGSEEGLSRLNPKTFSTLTKKEGLTVNTVVTVCADRDNGVWISAWGGGLNHWKDDHITIIGNSEGLSSDFIMAMVESRDGSLWAGADYGNALNHVKGGEITQYGSKEGFVASAGSATLALCEDGQGVLWMGDREGLQRWDGTHFSRLSLRNYTSTNKVNALCAGPGDQLWIGTEAGLIQEHGSEFKKMSELDPRLQAPILSLYEDAEQSLWIGTKGHGLLHWKNEVLSEFTSKQGLFSDSIYGILEDNHTNLWLSSSRGIFLLRKKQMEAVAQGQQPTLTSINYGKTDGILSSGQPQEALQPAACKSTDGRLWFRTTQGVAIVDPDDIKLNELPPPVVIRKIVADKKLVKTTFSDLKDAPGLTLEPGRGELEIHYAALSFRSPEKNRFRYQLAGVDLNWMDAGTRRVAFYNNLRPGRYRFQVTACNNDGVWSETGASLSLVLRPRLWQTGWFFCLVVVSLVGLVGGTARYITRRRMQRRLDRLEAVETERYRIARDIHDDVGAGLTQLVLRGEIAQTGCVPGSDVRAKFDEICEMARTVSRALDEVVWTVNSRRDTLRDFAFYTSEYAQTYLSATSIRCRLDVQSDMPAAVFDLATRRGLFLAVKEALHNVVKYSAATELSLAIRIQDEAVLVVVEDNGCGFETSLTKGAGNGLLNMKQRLEEMGGQCTVASQPGAGCRVEFKVPLMFVSRKGFLFRLWNLWPRKTPSRMEQPK